MFATRESFRRGVPYQPTPSGAHVCAGVAPDPALVKECCGERRVGRMSCWLQGISVKADHVFSCCLRPDVSG